jgi:hypothetical protein
LDYGGGPLADRRSLTSRTFVEQSPKIFRGSPLPAEVPDYRD